MNYLYRIMVIVLLFASSVKAENIFIDPQDGYLDASRWLFEHSGFLPVPIVITEPAVGFGLGVALVFMDKSHDKPREGHFAPPTVKGLGGFGTENGSRGAFGFYIKNWDEDRWRYMGAVAGVGMNLDFYGAAGFPGKNQKFAYDLDGFFIVQDIRRRLGESNFFAGLRYIYSDLKTELENAGPLLSGLENENKNGGLSVLLIYDSRDNTMSPLSGAQVTLNYNSYSESLGGDLNYQIGSLDAQYFWKWSELWGGAFRLLGKWSTGGVPFYAKPFIDVRGIAKQRYQGDYALSSELEFRYHLHPRWQVSVFGGGGKAVTDTSYLDGSETAGTYGAGFRYLIARLVGFQMGLDIAQGPEETVFYIQAGSAWF
ncbi:BamA/TamA family outer membrane protein [Bdellovibrio bacteriovorus]|uniref:BamA/TamA family outer membrane protein n=1 Tax=Bdellovibrio bacteriovorus TaxID=959 RepID=UPI0035A583EA